MYGNNNILLVQTIGWTYNRVDKSILNNRTTRILGFKRIIKSVILTQFSNSKMYTDHNSTSMWDSFENLKFIKLLYYKFLIINL